MNKILVGYSGFVGSNICDKEKFDGLYDSKNIQEAYGIKPDLLIYSGVPAQKFIANNFPHKDFEVIIGAIENIKKIKSKKIVLISTIDVYNETNNVNEETIIDIDKLLPYGKNRYYLERWVKENYEDYLIVHLPALYGKNIKKNFIYDLINVIPSMLNKEKFTDLINKDNYIEKYYQLQENGYYKLKNDLTKSEKEGLKKYFENIGFSALNFTDSRATYQFYNLSYLYKHIQIALNNGIKVLNLSVEPIIAKELYKYVKGNDFNNEFLTNNIPNYNFKTKYDNFFNGKNGYIFNKEFVLKDLKNFIDNYNK